MTLYAVTVIRTEQTTIYVHANDWTDARTDGKELAQAVDEWDPCSTDVDVNEVSNVPTGHSVWSGGEDGRWIEP